MATTGQGPLPMFPLGTVLVPGMSLPLHVFEARYRALAQHCVDTQSPFGVMLIARGSEVGGGDVRHDVGCLAVIEHAVRAEDGRWGLLCRGTERFSVVQWHDDDPFPRASIRLLEDRPVAADIAAERIGQLTTLLRRTLALGAEAGLHVAASTTELPSDPTEALWAICELAPIGDHDRYHVVKLDDPIEQYEVLGRLLAGAREVIQYELSHEGDADDVDFDGALAEWVEQAEAGTKPADEPPPDDGTDPRD
jgi:uncharacterized protein